MGSMGCDIREDGEQNGQIERLRQISRNIGLFWCAITLTFLVAVTTYTLAREPGLLGQPRGWAILALGAAFAAWYLLGQWWWMTGRKVGEYYSRLMRRELSPLQPRAIVLWLGLLAIVVGLSALHSNLRFLLYAVYGMTLALLPMPWTLLLTAPTVLVIFVEFGWLPQQPTLDSWAQFLLTLALFAMYTAFAYLPLILLAGRFERERVHAELERSHRALAEAHRQLAEAAERERELAVLRERERLARDLHDTIGHALVLASVKLEAALRLRAVDAARADHEIVATQNVLRGTMTELRATLANLRSPDLAREPLDRALARRAEEAAARAGWRVEASLAPDLGPLDQAAYETLLRVGTEALANAERHARAHTVSLTLAREAGSVALRVADDGVGIGAEAAEAVAAVRRPALVAARGTEAEGAGAAGEGDSGAVAVASPPGHYGITGMRERVAAAGGTLTIAAGPDGRGTVVEARVPARAS